MIYCSGMAVPFVKCLFDLELEKEISGQSVLQFTSRTIITMHLTREPQRYDCSRDRSIVIKLCISYSYIHVILVIINHQTPPSYNHVIRVT